MGYKIALVRGDGVGPEVVSSAVQVLREVGFDAEYIEIKAGLSLFKETGKPIEDEELNKIKECDAALKGPIATLPGPGTYQSVNVLLRKYFNLYVNFRPFENLVNDKYPYFNFIIFRENTEELYTGAEWTLDDTSIALRIITKSATQRIVNYSFNYALKNGRRRITVVHKANILKETDGLFRETFFKESKKYTLQADEVIVDSAAYQLVKNPEQFDILVTPNLYGDILSDLAAGLVGSLGLCGSANIGDSYAIFEPVHGVAWDIAGKGIANPIGAILSSSYLL
ncbi:MAG: isocitrate/isopropylmalate family dehydrogenase, partial [Thermoproteota archaeon]